MSCGEKRLSPATRAKTFSGKHYDREDHVSWQQALGRQADLVHACKVLRDIPLDFSAKTQALAALPPDNAEPEGAPLAVNVGFAELATDQARE